MTAARKRRANNKKRWIQFGSPIEGITASTSTASVPVTSSSASPSDREPQANQPFLSPSSTIPTIRTVNFPTTQKCFSEAGYGADRRIDMTGRRFQQRYNIDPTLIPTPFLDPERDNKTIWSRWRMDKVIERYQQPGYEDQEILCLGHVYRLLPGGIHRAWVEFGQHLRYTDKVHTFVDEILNQLLPASSASDPVQEDSKTMDENKDENENGTTEAFTSLQPSTATTTRMTRPFIGVHLRRGDFYRHCLGITSPADPNGWNRCYPSTEHIISLLNTHTRRLLSSGSPSASPSTSSSLAPRQDSPSSPSPAKEKLPVLVLTNERDPEELAKADDQNWIRVDHHRLGTLDRFGPYGPILLDGALLARAKLLVGVEYSTYFKTASKRAETWYGGQTLLVT
ncbi:hypothetical protein BC939DRAFT_465909 [Gamsiella multidivaricata]|uniref:uncharacterized protein n=1 Tax=Gamsiella multidivaricata TaxID=101098 RepID=UPI00221F5A8E|nr:uncharacterized protein BC939DRAFT_465909 [Gamsiella multidivaricata]KAI7817451.1 hypothetical protein BC939DRAFT_465909 [Gamsiella multidivaricata]